MTEGARLDNRTQQLLKGKNFGSLATQMPNGEPQVTPVWVDTDGVHVLVNTAEGRQKARNLREGAPVAIAVIDHENPYSYVQVRGHVTERTHEGAEEHIRDLNQRYHGNRHYPLRPGEQRVIVKIRPERVTVH